MVRAFTVLSRPCALLAIAAAVAVVTILGGAGPAMAQSCRGLQAELASALRGGGNAAQYRRFSDAVRRQTREIAIAERDYRRLGCARSRDRQCRTIAAALGDMQSNLSRLTRLRDSHAGGASRREIARLRQAVSRACDSGRQTRTASIRRETGTRTPVRPQIATPRRTPGPLPSGPDRLGTMCVRTCDGYFFPISFATGRDTLERDRAVCAALCPAAPTRLFAHPSGADNAPMSMIALDGTAYTDLETAFEFRDKPRRADCTCGRPDPGAIGVAGIIAPGKQADAPAGEPLADMPRPQGRPDLAADPETATMTRHTMTPGLLADIARTVEVGEVYDVADRREDIRVVGGQFLPDPEEAIDLRAPDRRSGP
ncbi:MULTISPECIES: DUF2865 domain-containing protein [unclassified Roseitalea]|uniref:DUF2865 domain-containing protein n=1 Tax=unclassified Roseitalea TaxID=2639107 RepID=UPI00273DAB6A|nr:MULTISPECIES: DUF2865 domain-containing protein [unclassified Roseitalea]